MKIIDRTPFYNEKGEISLLDRLKSYIQLGKSWVEEMEAQKSVLPMLEKVLDKNYTLLRNFTLPGLETPIPFILVGPSGVYVMCVTPLLGMYRAKGDQWGTITGNNFRPEKINLVTRTDRMARAVHVYLQRQGYNDITNVEAILLCTNPGVHVDSLRPIVRVVLRDALERFAISILQGRMALRADMVYDVVNRIVEPPAPKEQNSSVGTEDSPSIPGQERVDSEGSTSPNFISPDSKPATGPEGTGYPAFLFGEEQPDALPHKINQPPPEKRTPFSRKQWIFLTFLAVVWLVIMVVFIFLVVQDLFM